MDYAYAAYFNGDHCQHVAARQEYLRVQRKWRDCRNALARHAVRR